MTRNIRLLFQVNFKYTLGDAGSLPDWAVIKLDRVVPSSIADPVTVWRGDYKVSVGQAVIEIGYPMGLPKK